MSEFLGIENSALKFVIAFVLVMALIGLTAWLIRQFGSARPNSTSGGRARQPRLAVLDSAVVDARRRLVLIRRDNVEHLLMIGGPTDVVVEANVVRAQPAAAPAPVVAPQRMAPPQRVPIEPVEVDYDPSLVPLDEPYYEEPPLPPRPAPQRPAPQVRAPVAPPPPPPHVQAPAPAPHVQVPPPMPHLHAPQPSLTPQPGPRMTPPQRPAPAAPPVRGPAPQPQYSDMAQRLEAALRAPAPEAPARPAPELRPAPPPRAEPQLATPPAPAAAAPAPDKDSKASDVFSSLEEEMANLLKPSGGKDSA